MKLHKMNNGKSIFISTTDEVNNHPFKQIWEESLKNKNKMTNLIGISGKIGSGKDTVGSIIQYLTYLESYKKHCIENNIIYNEISYGGFIKQIDYYTTDKYTNWNIKKFAGKLKQIVSILTGIPVNDLERQDVKDQVLGEEWNFVNISKGGDSRVYRKIASLFPGIPASTYSVRTLLQFVGTNAMRDVIHENIWVNALFADYTKPAVAAIRDSGGYSNHLDAFSFPNWIITDVRFPNEAEAIKERNGIIIRVNRKYHTETIKGLKLTTIPMKDGIIEPSTHPSETALDDYAFNHVIHNKGTMEELIVKVKQILLDHKII